MDGGKTRARGFRIDQGGTLNVDAPLLLTVTSSFAPDKDYATDLGRKNDGLIVGLNEVDLHTTATFNKPVTVIVTNDGNKDGSNQNAQKGLATALLVEQDCTVNFNADTLLMAGNNPGANILTKIAGLRTAAKTDPTKYDELVKLTGTIDDSLRNQFMDFNSSQGIRIGDGANVNFNAG